MTHLTALIDGSVYAASVCDHAAWVASRTGATVDVLHVLGRRTASAGIGDLTGSLTTDDRESLLSELTELEAQQARVAQKKGRLILEQVRARLEAAGIAGVQAKLRQGDLLETVQELEAASDLIVIGKRGEAANFAKLHLGSNLERVVRASRKPVLVASRAFKPVERFLVAYDGGTSILKAIRHIAGGPLFQGLDCHMLMVGDDNPGNRHGLEAAADILRGSGYTVTTAIKPGQPDEVIARHVEEVSINLLVMGAYGHSRLRTLIIGSTTAEMVRSCLIPVMLFR
ncbi:universal stress protein [Niveispirillum sp. SYP-B3756]|uniref:universal stress protein n=1 Tax=Niveispirillum sp. SYP-B3756 TaxID=2662178 RepID=UPI0012929365|nr:universal stress protein [Niveispirillum sp. SYP-B3756]MQP68576.1 universal stress protein [Niveispirillum sp. SYP-B3756]